MTKKIFRILILLSSLNIALAQEIYVHPNGSDDNSGSIEAPLKTIQKAFQIVATNASIHKIYVRQGVYNFSNTITLTSNHSRSATSPLIISSYQDEKVTFTSNKTIASGDFKSLKEMNSETINRVPVNSRDHVYVANLSGQDFLQNLDEGQYGLISWKGYSLPVAQWPNKGFGYVERVTDIGPFDRFLGPGESPPPYSFESPSGGKFIMESSCAMNLNLLDEELNYSQDIALEGYLHNDWYYDRNFLARVNVDTGEMQLLKHTRYGVNDDLNLPRRFKLLNALSQLDMPGEWYFDKKTGLFFIWPIQPINSSEPLIEIQNIDLFSGSNLSHINFEHINFSGFGNSAIKIEDSEYISVNGCSFSSSQNGRGVRLNRVLNSTVKGCDFFDLYNAFTISGRDENYTNLVQEHNVAINNHIYNCSLKGYGLAAISGVGGYFANNLIHDVNGGVLMAGNDHIMEYNEIYNAGYGMGDWNSIYFGGNLSYFGNVIQKNFFHHFPEIPSAHPITALRGDDGCSGLSMNNNIFYKTGRGGANGSGPDVHVEGNVVMKTSYTWYTVQLPGTPISKQEYLEQKVAEHEQIQQQIANGTLSVNDKSNYLGRAELVFGTEGWKYNTIWINKYPNFSKIFDLTDPESHPWAQSYSTHKYNYISEGKSPYIYSHGQNPKNTIEDIRLTLPNTAEIEAPVIFNPSEMFENPDALDFRFKDSFTAMDGFIKWDFEKVGLYIDDTRKEMPDKNSYRNNILSKYDGISSSGGSLNIADLNLRYPDPAYLSELTLSRNSVPGIIEAESYDEGCNGVNFYDLDPTNKGGQYRHNAVDIEVANDSSGEYNIGYIGDGEWLEYTIHVEKTDNYQIEARIASPNTSGLFNVMIDNEDLTGSINVPSTGGYQQWESIKSKNVYIQEGKHVLRFNVEKGGFNLNWLKLTGSSEVSDDSYTVKTVSETCLEKNNGKIVIEAKDSGNYVANLDGGADIAFSNQTTIENLTPGTYELCIINLDTNGIQCYSIEIVKGVEISGKVSTIKSGKVSITINKGTAPFTVYINKNEILQTFSQSFTVDAFYGDEIEVKSSIQCEGTFKNVLDGIISVFPNPTNGEFNILFDTDIEEVEIEIYDVLSQVVTSGSYRPTGGKIALDINDQAPGVYFVSVQIDRKPKVIKIIKK